MINLLLLVFLISGSSAFAQQNPLGDPDFGPDTASRKECLNKFVYMHDHAKQEQYNKAISGWRYCFTNCPKAKKTIYTDGEDIMLHKIKNTKGEERQAYVDTLMMIYDQRIEHFGQKGYVLSKKGTYLAMYANQYKKAYETLSESIEERGIESSTSTLKNHMNFSTKLGDAGALDKKQVVDDFTESVALLQKMRKATKSNKKKKKIQETLNAIEKMFTNSNAASCDILEDVYKPKYKASPDSIELMVKITSLLEKSNCTESKFYASASEKLYELRPSAGAAAHLASLFKGKKKFDKAIEYYEEAIEKSEDSTLVSEYYQQIGSIYYEQKSNNIVTVSKAKEALKYDESNGAAYILMALAYADASANCGENDFQHSAVYWVAVDKLQMAKKVDPSVADKAQQLISAYSQRFPNNEDAFMFGNVENGDSYSFYDVKKCWIKETTTVRTRKR